MMYYFGCLVINYYFFWLFNLNRYILFGYSVINYYFLTVYSSY